MAHHVVTKVAEKPGRHGRQVVRQIEPGERDQRAQGLERLAGHGPLRPTIFRKRCRSPIGTPDEVGIEAEKAEAAALLASLHRLEEERVRVAKSGLDEGGDRRVDIVDNPRVHKLRDFGLSKVLPVRGQRWEHLQAGVVEGERTAELIFIDAAILVVENGVGVRVADIESDLRGQVLLNLRQKLAA